MDDMLDTSYDENDIEDFADYLHYYGLDTKEESHQYSIELNDDYENEYAIDELYF